MTADEIAQIQVKLGLSDGKMAKALGITRQSWRNWRTGRVCPRFAQNALRWMLELRRLSPDNDNLPDRVRVTGLAVAAIVGAKICEHANLVLVFSAA